MSCVRLFASMLFFLLGTLSVLTGSFEHAVGAERGPPPSRPRARLNCIHDIVEKIATERVDPRAEPASPPLNLDMDLSDFDFSKKPNPVTPPRPSQPNGPVAPRPWVYKHSDGGYSLIDRDAAAKRSVRAEALKREAAKNAESAPQKAAQEAADSSRRVAEQAQARVRESIKAEEIERRTAERAEKARQEIERREAEEAERRARVERRKQSSVDAHQKAKEKNAQLRAELEEQKRIKHAEAARITAEHEAKLAAENAQHAAEQTRKFQEAKHFYNVQSTKPEWSKIPDNLAHPEWLRGRFIAGFTHDPEQPAFQGRVLAAGRDRNRPGMMWAMIETDPFHRQMVELTATDRALLYHESHTPPELPPALTEAQAWEAIDQARKLQKSGHPHDARTQGPVEPVRLPDGTILMPDGVWLIAGREVHVNASAYLPPPPGMAEVVGLQAAMDEGYTILRPLAQGGTRHVYLVEKNGVKFALKILDPDKMFPAEAYAYEGVDPNNPDWRKNPNLTPAQIRDWRHHAEELAAKLANREAGMEHDIGNCGFRPLPNLASARLGVRGVQVYELFGEMTMGEAIQKHPELANDPEVIKRLKALGKVDRDYSSNVNFGYYANGMGYHSPFGDQPMLIGIDMKPLHPENPWDNTRVNIKIINGKAVIVEARDVDW